MINKIKSIFNSTKMSFILLTLVFSGTVGTFAWIVNNVSDNSEQLAILIKENQNRIADIQRFNRERIADIQAARIESCEKTYEGIRKVFRPFFPPPPRTPEQQNNLDTFNETIRILQKGCVRQTGQG